MTARGAVASAERFAGGELVLVGGERESPIFVTTPADTVTAATLERMHELGRGMVVLAIDDTVARRLALPAPAPAGGRRRLDLPFTSAIDAAGVVAGGWSLDDRARTMRVAADPAARPHSVTLPGHVHPVCFPCGPLPASAGAAAAALELARLAGRPAAVALCAVVDRRGRLASLGEALEDPTLARMPFASTDELRSSSRAQLMTETSASCRLPTGYGDFHVVAHVTGDRGEATLALVHGRPAARQPVLVVPHHGCLLGDVFGSLACGCRGDLDRAFAAVVAEGAGIVLYTKSTGQTICGGRRSADPAVAAALLRDAGATALRLAPEHDDLAAELRVLGLAVELAESARPRRAA